MPSKIEQQVMAGVGVIYAARLAVSRSALECYALVASAVALWQLTWVHMVFANFRNVSHGGVGAAGQYVLFAFEHTHLAVQLSVLVGALAVAGLMADAARVIRLRPLHQPLRSL